MKKILLIILIPVYSFAQDISFSSANISGNLDVDYLVVDDITIDNVTIGLGSDTDLITIASGSINVAGDLATSSDINLKTNIASFGPALEKILLLNPKSYTMKGDLTKKEKIGLLAQEVKEVFPELVTENGYMSVNYQALIPILIDALNEQTLRNKSLKERIDKLIIKKQ